jgi:hypothetical protein
MLEDKIKNAKSSDWLSRGLTEKQIKRIVFFARLKAKILLFIENNERKP